MGSALALSHLPSLEVLADMSAFQLAHVRQRQSEAFLDGASNRGRRILRHDTVGPMNRASPVGFRVVLMAMAIATAMASSCRAYKTTSKATGAGASGNGVSDAPNASQAGMGGIPPSSDEPGEGAGAPAEAGAASDRGGAGGETMDANAGGDSLGGAGPEEALAPSSFQGLALWLVASRDLCEVDGDERILRCEDLSGNLNDAVQLDPERRPTLASDVMTGHATLHFEAPSAQARPLVVSDSGSLKLGKKDFVVALVAGWRNPTGIQPDVYYGGYGIMLSKQQLTDPYTGITLLANCPGINPLYSSAPRFGMQLDLEGASAVSASPKLNDGNLRLLVAKRAGLELELRINGASETRTRTIDVLDVSSAGHALLIGGVDGAPLMGDVAELAVIGGEMPEARLEQLERYFLRKFGF